METLGSRIRLARGSLTQAELASRADLSRQSINNYEADKTTPSASALARISQVTGISLDHLLWGRGGAVAERPDRPYDARLLPPADASMPPIPILSEGQAGMLGEEPLQLNTLPVEHLQALKKYAGSGLYWEGDNELWLTRPADVRDLNAYSVRVKGDSMLPMFKPGQHVVASPIKQVYSGDVAVVKIIEDAVLIKTVIFERSRIILKSYNQAHEDMSFERDRIEFMDKIVWVKM